MFSGRVECQTTSVDYYWNFKETVSVNGNDYVMEQVTKDDRFSFGFLRKFSKFLIHFIFS